MSSCSHCRSLELIIDIRNGDTICTDCGTCQYDIILDQYGNHPPDPKTTLSIYEVSESGNIEAFGKRLHLFFELYDVPSSLQDYGLLILSHVEQHKISLKGNHKDFTCLAILYLTYENFGISWDLEAVCRDFKIKTKKIINIATKFQANTSCDHTLKLQNNIFKMAHDMDISIKNLDIEVIRTISSFSKSTKMKTAIALYIAAPPKLEDIVKNIQVQKRQLLKATYEITS